MTTPIGATPQLSRALIQRILAPLPNAAANIYGAPVALSWPNGVQGVVNINLNMICNGVAGENLIVEFTFTFSDGSQNVLTTGALVGNAMNPGVAGNDGRGAAWSLAKDGLAVTGVSVRVQSSIANSTAAPQVLFNGLAAL